MAKTLIPFRLFPFTLYLLPEFFRTRESVIAIAASAKAKRVKISRIKDETIDVVNDTVAREFPLTIVLNGKELVSLLCSPWDLDFLGVGFLFSAGMLHSRKEIERIHVDAAKGVVWIETTHKSDVPEGFAFRRLITSGCGKGIAFAKHIDGHLPKKISSNLSVATSEIFMLMREFQSRSETYRTTGGVHSAGLCNKNGIIVFNEDIGRHSAIDKVLGECVLRGISTKNRVLITSGRLSSEIVMKVASGQIPVLVSRSAPTDLGVRIAKNLGMTLVGFVRGYRMNIYSNPSRIKDTSPHKQE